MMHVLLLTVSAIAGPPPPSSVPANLHELECAFHTFALEFGTANVPSASKALHDALNLDSCAGTAARVAEITKRAQLAVATAPAGEALSFSFASVLHVATTGSDTSGTGSVSAPFATLGRAQKAAQSAAKPASVVVAAGKYHLNSTLKLGASDSGVAWSAAPGAAVTLSGGVALNPSWTKSPTNPKILVADLPQPGLISEAERAFWQARAAAAEATAPPSLCANTSMELGIDYAGNDLKITNAPTPEACCALCTAYKGCTAWTHRAVPNPSGDPTACWLKSSAKGRHCSGAHTSGQLGVAKPPTHHCPSPSPHPHPHPHPHGPPPPPHKWGSPPQLWNTLHVDGVRQVRARFPNGNAQDNSGKCFSAKGGLSTTGEGCDGWLNIQGKAGSLPRSTAGFSFKSGLDRNQAPTAGGPTSDGKAYGTFKYTVYDPPSGHPVYNKPMPDWTWKNNSLFSFWNDPLSHAVGGVGYKSDINKTYANAATAVVHMFHGGLWGGWSFQVQEQDTATQSLLFSHGGYQEARGAGGGKHYYGA